MAREPLAPRRARAAAAPKRPSRLRLWLRRHRGLKRPALFALGGLALAGAAVAGLLALDPAGRIAAVGDRLADIAAGQGLEVTEVVLEGRANTPPELLREALAVTRGDPILAFSPQAARERLEMIAWVERAHVERHLPGTIRVRIEERRPFAIWQRDGKLAVIDREGQVVATENPHAFGALPLVVGAGADRAAASMIDLLRATPVVMDRTLALVRVAERRWNLRLRTGTDVLLPEAHEAPAVARLAELQAKQGLLDRPLAAIDLRLPDKMVLRLPNTPAPPELQRVRSNRG